MGSAILSIAALLVASVVPVSGEPVEIPLDSIWGLDMPGTRDMRELDPRKGVSQVTAIMKISQALMETRQARKEAGPCFVVRGSGKLALQNAVSVIIGNEERVKLFPSHAELSLFFFSSPAPGYVHLHSAHLADDRLIIKYKVIPHQSAEITTHFALIPLGKLQDGEYTVDIERIDTGETSPPGAKVRLNAGQIKRAVCAPCSFTVGLKLQ